jgi:small subunit ribosomal protein S20
VVLYTPPADLASIDAERRTNIMANIKSAIKRIRQSRKRALRNEAAISAIKTAFKKAAAAIAAKSADAKELVLNAVGIIDKAVTRGIVHRNTSARKKSRLLKKFNQSQSK